VSATRLQFRPWQARRFLASATLAAFGSFAPAAHAYPHIVQAKETLAEIAYAVYGDPNREPVLAGANGLDARGGSMIVPGVRLEVPAPIYVRSGRGENWQDLAVTWLGSRERSQWLAKANNAVPWVPPAEGTQVMIPAVVVHIAGEREDITSVSKRYGGDAKRAWELNAYNGREGVEVKPGEIILVPIYELTLTSKGRDEAKRAGSALLSEGGASSFQEQRRIDGELPVLLAELRNGRYPEVLARAGQMLSVTELSRPQLTVIHRAMTESYVALDVPGAAAASCKLWLANAQSPVLEPRLVSPKIRAVCNK
jgi:hypothetical protein